MSSLTTTTGMPCYWRADLPQDLAFFQAIQQRSAVDQQIKRCRGRSHRPQWVPSRIHVDRSFGMRELNPGDDHRAAHVQSTSPIGWWEPLES
jgi:hypothetical protein